jgi:hypothetical protein
MCGGDIGDGGGYRVGRGCDGRVVIAAVEVVVFVVVVMVDRGGGGGRGGRVIVWLCVRVVCIVSNCSEPGLNESRLGTSEPTEHKFENTFMRP